MSKQRLKKLKKRNTLSKDIRRKEYHDRRILNLQTTQLKNMKFSSRLEFKNLG